MKGKTATAFVESFRGAAFIGVLLGVIGLALHFLLPSDPGHITPELLARFLHDTDKLRPEPMERSVFLGLTFMGGIATWLWHLRRGTGDPKFWKKAFLVFCCLAVINGASSRMIKIMYQPLADSWFWIPFTAAWAIPLSYRLLKSRAGTKSALARRGLLFISSGVALYFISSWKWFGISALRDDPTYTFHFSSVFYPLTQAIAGKLPLLDYTSLYGYFGAFLAPWFKAIGLSVSSFTATMAFLQWVSLVALFVFSFRQIKSAIILTSTFATLIVCTQTWAVIQNAGDPYFQYWPVRFVFPALSLLVFSLGWVGLGVFSGIALIWNLDAGVAVLGSFCALAFYRHGFVRLNKALLARQLSLFFMAVAAMVASFFVSIFLRSGVWADPSELIKFQRIFYDAGYFMLPMPVKPHLWHLVIGVYLMGASLSLFVAKEASGEESRKKAETLFFLSVLGMGLFPYYQGRSHDFVLTAVLWPAVVEVFVLIDLVLISRRKREIPKSVAWVTVLPGVFLGVMSVILLVRSVFPLWEKFENARLSADTEIESDSRYIGSKMNGKSECVILSRHQAAYFAENRLGSSLKGPGVDEGQLILAEDAAQINQQLETGAARDLFIESYWLPEAKNNPFAAGLRDFDARYRIESVSPTGRIRHFVRIGP